MKIQPLENFHLIGTSIRLSKNKVYEVQRATNLPNYLKRGLVFCNNMLLNKNDYKIIPE